MSSDIREVIGTLWGSRASTRTSAKHVAEQHRRIADAVGRREAAAAADAMRDHLLWAVQADLHGLGEPRAASLLAGTIAGRTVGLVIGIDTGGTFTDMVVLDPATGHVDSLKTSSIPSAPGQAIVNALDEGGVAADEIETFTHGTTVGTNALIERTGCRVAFVTTKGFEDTPFIQRINRKVLYDLGGGSRSRSSRAGGSASGSTSGSMPRAPRSDPSTRAR